MSRARRAFGSWLEKTSRRENGAALALSRVLIAACVLELVLPLLLTSAGRRTVHFAFCDVTHGGYRHISGSWFLDLLGGAQPTVMFSLLGVAALSASLLFVGIFGRLPAVVCAVCTHTALTQNSDASGSGDALLGVALFILILGDCTATLSLDCFARTRRWLDHTPIAGWPRLLGLFHLTTVYVVTGLQKLVSTAWSPVDDFSALYQILQSPHWARFPRLIEENPALWAAPLAFASAATMLFELGFWLVFVSRRARVVLALIGVCLHVGISVFMEVGVFSWISLALYPLLFPERAEQLLRRGERGRRGNPKRQASPATTGSSPSASNASSRAKKRR